ncbi:MAG: hypothetical protein ACPLSP_01680, partial [Fervidicoccus fontis]
MKQGFAEYIANDLRQQGYVVTVVNCRRRSGDRISGNDISTWLHYWADFIALLNNMPEDEEDVIIFDGHPKYTIRVLSTLYGAEPEAIALQMCIEALTPEVTVDLALVIDSDVLTAGEETSIYHIDYLESLRKAYLDLKDKYSEVRIIKRYMPDEGLYALNGLKIPQLNASSGARLLNAFETK